MGFRSTWIADPVAAREQALAATGLVTRGKTTQSLETGWYGLRVGSHYLVIGSGWDYRDRLTEAQAITLSAHGESFFWAADDTTMCSYMAAHRDGALVWAFTHDEEDPAKLDGAVPDEVRAIVAEQQVRQRQEQRGEYSVDYVYDAAHRSGLRLVGFRHDDFDAPEGTSFEVLVPVDAPPPHEQRKGPLMVRLELGRDGTAAEVEALSAIEVRHFRVLSFTDGELAGVVEHAGRALRPGERVGLWCPQGDWSLDVTLADGQSFEFRPPSRFSLSGLFKRFFSK